MSEHLAGMNEKLTGQKDEIDMLKYQLHTVVVSTSSSPRAFPSSGVAGMVINQYHYSTLFCPICPPPLTPHFPYLFYMSFQLFSVILFVSFLVLVHLTFVLARALLLTCPYHFSLFSVIFFVNDFTTVNIKVSFYFHLSLATINE